MSFLAGKRALIVGLASNRSIAWGIAEAMRRQGAELAFTYQNEKLQQRVEKMAMECGSEITMPCDVTSDKDITAVFDTLEKHWSNQRALADRVIAPGAHTYRSPTVSVAFDTVDLQTASVTKCVTWRVKSVTRKTGSST
jgi:NAD(P)-dependent dehydrogenase (short-subunit alcohol dehydrogenase family)